MERATMPGHSPSSIQPPRRILVRGVNWLGDAVMTTPALLRLRERFPDAHIALLSPEKLADLWLHHPAIDEVVSFKENQTIWEVTSIIRNYQPSESFREIIELTKEMPKALVSDDYSRIEEWAKKREKTIQRTKTNFDLALVLPNSPRSALEVFFARIPQRIGYARPWRNWFLTQAVPARPGYLRMCKKSDNEIHSLIGASGAAIANRQSPIATAAHQIHEYLHLTAALGASREVVSPRLTVTPEEIQSARNKFGLDKVTVPLLALNPGAEYGPAKRWPVERFIAAAREIQKQTNCVWLLLGGKADAALAEQIATTLRAPHSATRNLAGQTSLRELMALLKHTRVLLTNDTGPMHVAAALGTPVVVPFGSTSPELTGPGLPGDTRHRLLKFDAPCAPCFLRECPIDFRCMNGISVEQVVAAVLQAMAR